MFCHKCGKQIDDEAVVCIHCGASTKNLNDRDNKAINIVNQTSNSTEVKVKGYRRYSLALDIIMTFFTGGLWLIWVVARPK